jgi:succinate dehydrogenase/fumarate reductase cytochrome b subunit
MKTTTITSPVSPHLLIYKPQLSSTLSILHRITGAVLAFITLYFFWNIHVELDYGYFKGYNMFGGNYVMTYLKEDTTNHLIQSIYPVGNCFDNLNDTWEEWGYVPWLVGPQGCFLFLHPMIFSAWNEVSWIIHNYLLNLFIVGLLYHTIHGIRHFYWDSGLGLQKEKWNLLGGILLSFYFAFFIYNTIALLHFYGIEMLLLDQFPIFTITILTLITLITVLAVKQVRTFSK